MHTVTANPWDCLRYVRRATTLARAHLERAATLAPTGLAQDLLQELADILRESDAAHALMASGWPAEPSPVVAIAETSQDAPSATDPPALCDDTEDAAPPIDLPDELGTGPTSAIARLALALGSSMAAPDKPTPLKAPPSGPLDLRQLIATVGGPAKAADLAGVARATVYQWQHHGAAPMARVRRILEARPDLAKRYKREPGGTP